MRGESASEYCRGAAKDIAALDLCGAQKVCAECRRSEEGVRKWVNLQVLWNMRGK